MEPYFANRENIFELMEYLEQSKDLYHFIFSRIYQRYCTANVKRGVDLKPVFMSLQIVGKSRVVRQEREKQLDDRF